MRGDIFINSCPAQLISVQIESISKEINCAELEYMNMSPLLIELATLLFQIRTCTVEGPCYCNLDVHCIQIHPERVNNYYRMRKSEANGDDN